MGNKKWTRLVALCLAVVCTLTVVLGATELQFDKNGDGKTTVWDLQNVLKNDRANYEKAVSEALDNKGDELNPNSDNVYEIWTELGLRNMVKRAKDGCSFKLMADIDLGGKDWTPIANFKGNFNGNNKTISNFKITKSSGSEMGFFAVVDHIGTDAEGNVVQSVVENLNLRDVEITITEAARFVGMLTGSNRGKIMNCTAIGLVNDSQETLGGTVYIGTIAGRNNNSTPAGSVTGSNTLTADDSLVKVSQQDHVQMVHSKMATNFATLSYPEGTSTDKQYKRYIGVVGNSKAANITAGLYMQDITNSTERVGEGVQARREEVARYMYEMCTVPWTPSTQYATNNGSGPELRYYKYDQADTEWYDSKPYLESRYFAGKFYMDSNGDDQSETYQGGYYRGFPYNQGSSGMDRFLSMMDKNDNGIYTTNAELPDTAFYIPDQEMLNAVNAAYTARKGDAESYVVPAGTTFTFKGKEIPLPEGMDATISKTYSQIGFNMYIGADCSSQAAWAWRKISAVTDADFANVINTALMFPTQSNINTYGIQAVNGMTFVTPEDLDSDGKTGDDSGDKCIYLSDYMNANVDYWLETLALTSKGDLLMEYSPAGGHTRVAISDAVVIYSRGAGETYSLDTQLSYIVTAEQGGSGVDSDGVNHYYDVTVTPAWRSSCCVDRRMTFADLTINTNKDSDGVPYSDGYYRCYFPITCDALRIEDSDAAKVWIKYEGDTKVTSNFHIVSTAVNDGEPVYTGVKQSGQRNPVTEVTLSSVHAGIQTGDKVTVLLSDGQKHTITYGTKYERSYSVDDNLLAVN